MREDKHEDKARPVVIKRVKKSAHAATTHGGAWKIAYADFVTAMMAFFLLMWLLGSTAKGDLQGIADYFSAPLTVAMSGGDGAGSSTSIVPGGGEDLSRSHGQIHQSQSVDRPGQRAGRKTGGSSQSEARRIAALKARVDAMLERAGLLHELRHQVRTEIIEDGLLIQILDDQNRAMFDLGSAELQPHMRDILHAVGAALAGVQGERISLSGHTDAAPYSGGERGYSNWELSAERANASRRELVAAGMPLGQLARVVGLADSQPLLPEAPRAPQNRRITITVLTHAAQQRLLGHVPALAPSAATAAAQRGGVATAPSGGAGA